MPKQLITKKTAGEMIARRWGKRGASKQIRVDPDAAEALERVPENDRRRVASDAIRSAVEDYLKKRI